MSEGQVDHQQPAIVPFGKYRGQPIERLMADRDYCTWAFAQPALRNRFASVFAIIGNGGTAPDAPTPEHNRMQLLFRDPDLRVAVLRSVFDERAMAEATAARLDRCDASVDAAGKAAAADVPKRPLLRIRPQQTNGWRVAKRRPKRSTFVRKQLPKRNRAVFREMMETGKASRWSMRLSATTP